MDLIYCRLYFSFLSSINKINKSLVLSIWNPLHQFSRNHPRQIQCRKCEQIPSGPGCDIFIVIQRRLTHTFVCTLVIDPLHSPSYFIFLLFSYLSYTAPSAAPKNFTFELSEQQLTLSWAALDQEELHGRLLAYKVQWNQGGESQVHHCKGRHLWRKFCYIDSFIELNCFSIGAEWLIS